MKNKDFVLIKIAYIGALIALQVVLGNLVQIALLTKQMNFGFLPIAVAGYLLGPVAGLIVAALGDVLGTILFGTGAYFPGFTLTAAIVGLVYGFFLFPVYNSWISEPSNRLRRILNKRYHTKTGKSLVSGRDGELFLRALIASVVVAMIYILLNSYWLTYFISKEYLVILLGRVPFYLLEIPIYTVLITICCSQMKRLPRMLLPDVICKNIDEKHEEN